MVAAQRREGEYLQSHSPGGLPRGGAGDYSSRGNSLGEGQGTGGSLGGRENRQRFRMAAVCVCTRACVRVCVSCARGSVCLGVGGEVQTLRPGKQTFQYLSLPLCLKPAQVTPCS